MTKLEDNIMCNSFLAYSHVEFIHWGECDNFTLMTPQVDLIGTWIWTYLMSVLLKLT